MAAVDSQLQRVNGRGTVATHARATTVVPGLSPGVPGGRSVLTFTKRRTSPGIAPSEEAWAWQHSARCRDEDTAQFFHQEGERGRARKIREQQAKAICAQCPVVVQCLQHSLKFPEPYGIWGGMSEDERARLLDRTAATPPSTRATCLPFPLRWPIRR